MDTRKATTQPMMSVISSALVNEKPKAIIFRSDTPTMTGNFLKRDCDGLWRVSIDTDDEKVKAEVKNNWFKNVNAFQSAGG